MSIDPKHVRAQSVLEMPSIPINSYRDDIEKEKELYGSETLRNVYYDMLLIREFESMLDSIKKQSMYQDIAYTYHGPAHLSIGQESASVGQCLALDAKDWIFGSHRSHGEIIAKSMSATRKLPEEDCMKALGSVQDGKILSIIEKHHPADTSSALAEHYILYAVLAEIFSRITGCNRGLGGSMHACFIPLGSMPNNAIVGGSAPIAFGAALQRKLNHRENIVVANIGDAAMSSGPVWESLMLASMDQYHRLWGDMAGAPPFLLNVYNNFYGMGGQTSGETTGFNVIARIGAGINADALHAERLDGFNPLAVADAITRKRKILLEGRGPVLLDTITYRFSGHSPSDASTYRSKEEVQDFQEHDCIHSYGRYLQEHNILHARDAEEMEESIKNKMRRTLELAIDQDVSPFLDAESIEGLIFSRKKRPSYARTDISYSHNTEGLLPPEENSRMRQLTQKIRYGYDAEGQKISPSKLYTVRDAIFEAMFHRFQEDPSMIAFGEENRDWGGAFGCYRGLTESLPYHRLFNAPIAEAGIVGAGIGYALAGGRAVVELMYCDFLGRAGDEILNQMPKWQSMSGGLLEMPLVLRVSVGHKYGAQHSQDWTALLAHIPGLQIVYPATPYDAKGLLNSALTGSDPVVFFESQKLYGLGEFFHTPAVPEEYYEIEIGMPDVKREGSDITLVCIGPSLYTSMEVAHHLEETDGIQAEVIDLRSIYPLQYEPLIQSLQKTGRIALISEACERGSYLHTIASHLTSSCFDYLDAPPLVIAAQNWVSPPADLESIFFPQIEDILNSIDRELLRLPSRVGRQ